ncbi:MAG: MFS transporter [Lentisphaerae bacterium]|nr:MFS transporter [Lentisphaerota bacterium]
MTCNDAHTDKPTEAPLANAPPPDNNNYRLTIHACYLGFVVQALVINLTPILFIPLREMYGLSYQQLGLLVLINFVTQLTVDLVLSHPVDRFGYRPFIMVTPFLAILGFAIFALAPTFLPKNPYPGFVVGTVIFSGAGGLLEVLLSPIVNAVPSDAKAAAMSLLHSFYCWGQVGVVLITTLLLFVLGAERWQWIVALWLILPAIDALLFYHAPLAPVVPEDQKQGLTQILRVPFFHVALAAILVGGATELILAQWISAYLEKVMELPKVIGDIAGVCTFASMMGAGRAIYGCYGARFNVNLVMIAGSALAIICYIGLSLSIFPLLTLLLCALSGLAVSMLWPGALSISAARFPLAGTAMFAILAAGGDCGASIGPYFTSLIADLLPQHQAMVKLATQLGISLEQLGLRAAILGSSIFPVCSFFCLLWLYRHRHDGHRRAQ